MARNEEEGEHHPLCAAATFAILACRHQQQVQAGLMQLALSRCEPTCCLSRLYCSRTAGGCTQQPPCSRLLKAFDLPAPHCQVKCLTGEKRV